MFKVMINLLRALLPFSIMTVWGGVLLFTRYTPPPLPLGEPRAEPFGFAVCALPCYAGITVAETRFSDTVDHIIANIPALDRRLLAVVNTISFWGTAENGTISGNIDAQRGQVSAIRLGVALRIAWLIDALGAPTCFYPRDPSRSDSVTLLIWQLDDTAISAVLRPPMQPAAALVDVRLDKTLNLTISSSANECARIRALTWRGFGYTWAFRRRMALFAE